jgi:hypothetical protein
VAQPLVLGGEWHDAVECGAGDCADWFSLEIPGSGALELDLELSGPAEECAALRLALLDAVGVPLVKLAPQPGGAGGWQLRHRVRVRRGRYRLGVLASAARERVEYRLRASLAEVPVPDALPPTPRARPRR